MDDRRRIGLGTATALVVASMIGAGVFTTSGFTLASVGTPSRVLLAWGVGGVLALLGALSYGALAARIAESGGEYLFLARTLHPFAGFLAGWVSLLAGFTAPIALAAAGFQAYFGAWLPDGFPLPIVGTAAIAIAGALHGLRLRHGVRAQNAAVAIKLALLAAFVAIGATRLPDLSPAPRAPDFSLSAFCVSLVWISLSYSGWNAAVYVGGEVRDPQRNLPRSLVLGTVAVALLYLALNAIFVLAAPAESLAGQPAIAAVAARAIGGPGLEGFVRPIVALALFTSISAMVMSGPRVYARMAEDGLFPRLFSFRAEVPTSAVGLQCALAVGVLWVADLSTLLGYIGWTLSVSAAFTVVGLMRLRAREGAARVPVPGWPWVPAIYVLGTLGAGGFMAARSPSEPLAGLATVAVGAILYAGLRRRR